MVHHLGLHGHPFSPPPSPSAEGVDGRPRAAHGAPAVVRRVSPHRHPHHRSLASSRSSSVAGRRRRRRRLPPAAAIPHAPRVSLGVSPEVLHANAAGQEQVQHEEEEQAKQGRGEVEAAALSTTKTSMTDDGKGRRTGINNDEDVDGQCREGDGGGRRLPGRVDAEVRCGSCGMGCRSCGMGCGRESGMMTIDLIEIYELSHE